MAGAGYSASFKSSSSAKSSVSAHQSQNAASGFGGEAFRFGSINFGTRTSNHGAASGLGSVTGTTSPIMAIGLVVAVVGAIWLMRRKRA